MSYLVARINPAIFSTSRHVIIDCDGVAGSGVGVGDGGRNSYTGYIDPFQM